MKAYFDSIEKEVPEQLQQVFLNRRDTAVITIDMHDGHLSTDPDCPCPSPRGREIIEPLNHFMNEARALGLPIIHVRSTLRKGGADEKLFPSAWRMVFPVTVGEIPNIAEHAIEGTRWNRMSIDVHDEDYMVTTKKRLSAFYPTDLELLLRNLGIRRVVLTGCMTDCCVINTAFDAANRDFRDFLNENGVDLTYVEGPGKHDWVFWDTYIKKVLDWLPLNRTGAGINSGNVK